MNKSELVKVLSDKTSMTIEESDLIVQTMINNMRSTLKDGGRIELRGFGSFKMKKYESYTGRNPKTGEEIAVKPKFLPFFRAGKELKEYLNS